MKIEIYENPSQKIKEMAHSFGLEHFYNESVDIEEETKKIEEKYFSIPKAILLAYENKDVIGRTYLHKREIEFESKNVLVGGVGGICSHKNNRRQGIAIEMLKKSVEVFKKWNCHVAYLCTNIDVLGNLYRKVGFVPLNKEYSFYGKSGKLYVDDSGMLANVGSEEIFNEMLLEHTKIHLGNGNW